MNNLDEAKKILSQVEEKKEGVALISTLLQYGILYALIDIAEVLRGQKQ